MEMELKYINIFDDVNSSSIEYIQNFYDGASLKINGSFANYSFEEAENLKKSLNTIGELSPEATARHLESYALIDKKIANYIAKDIVSELRMIVPSEQALKSNYGKLAYWMKTLFASVINDEENSVFINCALNKYEIYMLYILSKLSNNVVIVDYTVDKTKYAMYNNIIFNISGSSEHLELSAKRNMSVEDALDILEGKQSSQGLKILITGEDTAGRLNSILVGLADNTPSNVVLIKDGISKPSFDEVNSIHRPHATSVEQLSKQIGGHMFGRHNKQEYAEKAASFIRNEINTESDVNKAVTKLISFICLYSRYDVTADRVVCYGKIGKTADLYLKYMADIGRTVLVIDTSGETCKSIITQEWIEVKLDNIVERHPYPLVMKSTTMAYNASREIDKTLYTGETLGLYRDRQYSTCNAVVLNTTFDEMLLLWKQDNVYKPSFSTTNSDITVPTFYAQLTGTTDDYEKTLGKLVTEHSVICYSPSQIMQGHLDEMVINHAVCINNTMFNEQKKMYKNGRLEIDTIIGYKTFTYRHLGTGVQHHIVSKLDELLADNWVGHDGIPENQFVDIVLNVGLNLSKEIQREMQWYDFTKQSPKLIAIFQHEEIMTLEQTIVITLLHLCGWDIVIAVPTGYNVLGRNLKLRALQEHTLGEPRFDLNINHLSPYSGADDKKKKSKGFFKQLFK